MLGDLIGYNNPLAGTGSCPCCGGQIRNYYGYGPEGMMAMSEAERIAARQALESMYARYNARTENPWHKHPFYLWAKRKTANA